MNQNSENGTTITSQNVVLLPIHNQLKGELAERICYECCFCGKTLGLYPISRRICEKLSGGDDFFCPFCLRHRFNTKMNKHVLILSFRGIVAYYFYEKYALANNRNLWVAEIQDCIDCHIKAGLMNPAFVYDPDSMLWFVDFTRVGRGKRKIRINEVLRTISNILTCFNLSHHLPGVETEKIFDKFSEAIVKFHKERYRPADKKCLIPTLAGCGIVVSTKFPIESTRYFTAENLTRDVE